ncbi:MAG: RNA polymerase sigma factor SigJ [Vulcanimicrobiaceae bacterium]
MVMLAEQDVERFRSRLLGIAYRMLGSLTDAEDVVQEAYLRWHQRRPEEVRSPEAWLVTVVSRLSIDRYRARSSERTAYVGPWLPEPVGDEALQPERQAEVYDDLSTAFLLILERLSAIERAAFLLREIFGYGYGELSDALGKNEAACRQLVHRAKVRIRQERPNPPAPRPAQRAMIQRFFNAIESGDERAILVLFDVEATFMSDGGGRVRTVINVVRGADKIARLLGGLIKKYGAGLSYEVREISGEPAVFTYQDGKLNSVITVLTDGEKILAMYSHMNPEKLAHFIDMTSV